MAASSSAGRKPKVPVTIITGFLGSGKTTLLRHILTAQHGRRICVIENEYGEDLGVEALVAKDGIGGDAVEDFFELSNGCLCCTVRDDLVETLERVLAKRDRYDYILIETTGMANPGPVATAFWQDEALESAMELDGIVTLCDCRLLQKQLARPRADGGVNEAAAQIAYADVVLLNKTDLADSAATVDATRARVRELNASCAVHECTHAAVDLSLILDIGAFDASTVAKQLQSQTAAERHDHGDRHDHEHEHRHEHGRHGSDEVETVVVRCAGRVEERRLTRWVGSLVWEDEGAPSRERGTMLAAVAGRGGAVSATTDAEGPAEAAGAASKGVGDDDDDAPPALAEALPADAVAVSDGLALAGQARAHGATGAGGATGRAAVEILRFKGVVAVSTGTAVGHKHVLQGVEDVFELRATAHAWAEGEEPCCSVLFIGRGLRRAELQEGLHACMLGAD